MNIKSLAVLLITSAVVVSLTGCASVLSDSQGGSSATNANPKATTDPRAGFVDVWTNESDYYITKRCDGTTLVYQSAVHGGYSIAVVPQSPECTN